MDGDTQYDGRKSQLLWSIDLLDDSNRTGSLEFVVPAANPDAFFPVEVSSCNLACLPLQSKPTVEQTLNPKPTYSDGPRL